MPLTKTSIAALDFLGHALAMDDHGLAVTPLAHADSDVLAAIVAIDHAVAAGDPKQTGHLLLPEILGYMARGRARDVDDFNNSIAISSARLRPAPAAIWL